MNQFTGWIIYPRYVSRHSDNAFGWLVSEAAACGITLSVIFIEDISLTYGGDRPILRHKGTVISQMPRFVIMRTYDTVISRYFERIGIPVINTSASMEACKNKMLTHEILCGEAIPTPLTIYSEGAFYDYTELSETFSSSTFIVKRTDGAKGENVYLVRSGEEMDGAIEKCGRMCICQEFVSASYGRDVRVWVIGGKAVGAVMRYSEISFLSNYSQGGKVCSFALTEDVARLAGKSAECLGAEFAGIDLLFTANGFMVNEVNGNAGFRTLSRVAENNIPAELFRYIAGKYSQS